MSEAVPVQDAVMAGNGPEPTEPWSARAIVGAVSLGAMTIVVTACWWLFQVLNRIDNSPADYQEFGGRIQFFAYASDVLLAAVSGLGWNSSFPSFRRAARFGVCVALICLLLIGSPVPFGYLAGLLLMIAAGRLGIVALHPAASAIFRSLRPLPLHVALVSAFAAGCGVASALLAMKGDGLGWAFAVD